eukprot:403373075
MKSKLAPINSTRGRQNAASTKNQQFTGECSSLSQIKQQISGIQVQINDQNLSQNSVSRSKKLPLLFQNSLSYMNQAIDQIQLSINDKSKIQDRRFSIFDLKSQIHSNKQNVMRYTTASNSKLKSAIRDSRDLYANKIKSRKSTNLMNSKETKHQMQYSQQNLSIEQNDIISQLFCFGGFLTQSLDSDNINLIVLSKNEIFHQLQDLKQKLQNSFDQLNQRLQRETSQTRKEQVVHIQKLTDKVLEMQYTLGQVCHFFDWSTLIELMERYKVYSPEFHQQKYQYQQKIIQSQIQDDQGLPEAKIQSVTFNCELDVVFSFIYEREVTYQRSTMLQLMDSYKEGLAQYGNYDIQNIYPKLRPNTPGSKFIDMIKKSVDDVQKLNQPKNYGFIIQPAYNDRCHVCKRAIELDKGETYIKHITGVRHKRYVEKDRDLYKQIDREIEELLFKQKDKVEVKQEQEYFENEEEERSSTPNRSKSIDSQYNYQDPNRFLNIKSEYYSPINNKHPSSKRHLSISAKRKHSLNPDLQDIQFNREINFMHAKQRLNISNFKQQNDVKKEQESINVKRVKVSEANFNQNESSKPQLKQEIKVENPEQLKILLPLNIQEHKLKQEKKNIYATSTKNKDVFQDSKFDKNAIVKGSVKETKKRDSKFNQKVRVTKKKFEVQEPSQCFKSPIPRQATTTIAASMNSICIQKDRVQMMTRKRKFEEIDLRVAQKNQKQKTVRNTTFEELKQLEKSHDVLLIDKNVKSKNCSTKNRKSEYAKNNSKTQSKSVDPPKQKRQAFPGITINQQNNLAIIQKSFKHQSPVSLQKTRNQQRNYRMTLNY